MMAKKDWTRISKTKAVEISGGLDARIFGCRMRFFALRKCQYRTFSSYIAIHVDDLFSEIQITSRSQ